MSLLKLYTDAIMTSKLSPYIKVNTIIGFYDNIEALEYVANFDSVEMLVFSADFSYDARGNLCGESFSMFNSKYDNLIDDPSLVEHANEKWAIVRRPSGRMYPIRNKEILLKRMNIEYDKLKKYMLDKEIMEIRKESNVHRK